MAKTKTVQQSIKRLVVPFQVKAVEDPGSHTFEGLAAVIGQKDLGNDIIETGAFTKTLATWKASSDALPLLNSHDQYNIMSALGQLITAKEQKNGLWTQWEVIPGPEGDAVMTRLTPSKITGRPIVGKMSIGYIPVKWEIEQPDGTSSYWDQIRHLTEVELKECSLVLFPMAPGAAIDASTVKSFLLSAQATEAKSLDALAKSELRRLATRIGILLQKSESAAPKVETPVVPKTPAKDAMVDCPDCDGTDDDCTTCDGTGKVAEAKADPEHPDTDADDDDDLDVVADLTKDQIDDPDAPTSTDIVDDETNPPKKGKKKKSDTADDLEIQKAEPYVYQEALAHRLKRLGLHNRVSAVTLDE